MAAKKNLIIIGGGFAGVYAANQLYKRLPEGWRVILFSQENHFIFTPLLGDVVGSSINPMHVVCPIRQMARHAECRTAAISRVDLEQRRVEYLTPAGHTAQETYDQLVLACGSVVNLDIIPGMAAHGWPLKTMGDALLLRNHLITQMEKAEVEPNAEARRRLLSTVVVGAGFSGVEVAGEINDLLKASCRFYTNVKPADIRVTLLEGRERILPELPEKLARFADRKMTKNGITIRTQAVAQAVTQDAILLRDGSAIEAGAVVCTIGTTTHALIKALGLALERGRIVTEPDMRVLGHENVWALGDCAAVPNAAEKKTSAPTAQFAVRQAKQLAVNIACRIAGKATRPFSFKPLGMMAAIGNHKAVGIVFGLKLSGFIAWFLWRGIYLSKMPTLARKIQIAFDWAWQLLFPRDIAQLALGATERFGRAHFEPGQFVFHKGDPGDRFYVIERGKAAVYLDEAAAPVAGLEKGDHFGEGALLHSGVRSASIRADGPLDVLVLGKESFGQITKSLDALRGVLERSHRSAQSAGQLLETAKDHPLLNLKKVAAVMAQPVATLAASLTLGEALERARALGKGAYPVVDGDGRMVGILTRTDFYNALQKFLPPHTALDQVMRRPVITVRASDSLTTALLKFLRDPIKRVVVVADDDDHRPVGMLTPFDIVKELGGAADAWAEKAAG
ncbi:MAG: FAD-dependent oxidoreductase [Gemmataceae bacterium]